MLRAIVGLGALVLVNGLLVSEAGANNVQMRLVTELDFYEVAPGHLHHSGHLWVSRSRGAGEEPHRLLVFDGLGENLVRSIDLPHTPTEVHPYGKGAVLVTGKRSDPRWQTFYTVVSVDDFSITTTAIPHSYQVSSFGGEPGAEFFTEVGDAAVIRLQRGQFSTFATEISNPGVPRLFGKDLFLIERRSFPLGDEGMVRINVDTGAVSRLFEEPLNGLTDFLVDEASQSLIAAEANLGQLVVASFSGQVQKEIAVGGQPRGLAAWGRCVLVMSDVNKVLSVVSLPADGEGGGVLESLDLSDAGDRLKQPRQVVAHPSKPVFFVRSAYVCGGCSVTQSSVFAVELPEESEVATTCLANQ